MKIFKLLVSYALVLALFGCAGGKPKLDPGFDPKPSVSEAEILMKQAERQQSDLLSFDEYMKAEKNLKKALQGLSGDSSPDYIVEKSDLAKESFQTSIQLAQKRTPAFKRILQARRASLNAGLRNSVNLVTVLANVDADLRDETDNFTKELEPNDFSDFQKKYLSLETKAVQFRELNGVKNSIQKAVKKKAEKLAPNSLRQARLDVNEASNLITQSPRDPAVHMKSVNVAVASSVLLTDVMEVISNAEGTPEKVALKVVYQNRELTKLSKNVGTLETNLKASQSSLKTSESSLLQKEGALETQNKMLKSTETAMMLQNKQLENNSRQVRFQKAMDEAIVQFTDDEAEVYQRGTKLIFRLKKVNFPFGSSYIPSNAKPLLAKVNKIITSLGAEKVDVHGHTDSQGSDEINANLSNKRALSVANYMSSLGGGYKLQHRGFGESKPIASNETAEGRAINRRVDLEITAKKIKG